MHQAERRKLVFQSQASGDAGCGLWHIRGTSAKTPKKAKIEANALKHGSKVATTFQRCLIIKHLCNKPLAFESSASANSATPALGDRSERIRDSRASSTSPRWRVRCPQRVLFARKDAPRSGQRTLQQIEPSQTARWPENFAKNNCVAQTGRRCKQRGDVCS